MIYGVKAIQPNIVEEKIIYEELVLAIKADSYDEAYDKAKKYMKDYECEYTNVNGKKVKVAKAELIDCFQSISNEDGIVEVYSSFFTNKSHLGESEYYKVLTSSCDENELALLKNKEFN